MYAMRNDGMMRRVSHAHTRAHARTLAEEIEENKANSRASSILLHPIMNINMRTATRTQARLSLSLQRMFHVLPPPPSPLWVLVLSSWQAILSRPTTTRYYIYIACTCNHKQNIPLTWCNLLSDPHSRSRYMGGTRRHAMTRWQVC